MVPCKSGGSSCEKSFDSLWSSRVRQHVQFLAWKSLAQLEQWVSAASLRLNAHHPIGFCGLNWLDAGARYPGNIATFGSCGPSLRSGRQHSTARSDTSLPRLKQAIHAANLLLQQKLQQLPKYWYGWARQLVSRNT